MKTIYLVKQQNGTFIPAMDTDKEITDQLSVGQTYSFKISKPRNYEFLQKFFVLCKLAFDNQSEYNNFDRFRHDLTVICGYYEEQPNYFTGEVTLVAKSISFAKMTEFEFKELYEAFIYKVVELYGFDKGVFV